MEWKRLTLAVGLSLVLAACGTATVETEAPPADVTEQAEGGVIVLGDISDDPAEVIEGAQPLADYLAARLGDYGITRGEVRVAGSDDELAQMLEEGEVDLYFDSVYPATLIIDETGAQPILRRWRAGVGEYHTVIFTTKDSGITSVEELEGHMVAMDNEFSTSGFVLPAVYLIEQGLTLSEKSSPDTNVDPDEVGYAFSQDDENTLQWVLSGLAAAGVTDNVHYSEFPPEALDQLVILAETESVARQVVVARPGLDPDLLEAITEVLLHAHEDAEGQAALEAFSHTAKFDELPEGIEATLDRMREYLEIIQGLD